MSKSRSQKNERLSWDELFMNLSILASKRTACKFVEAGAVFVDKHHKIISLGYNGPTEGDYHCIDVGCAKVDGDPKTGELKRCRGAHAEVNAIINTQDTTRLRGATLYAATWPCYDCMKSMNNAGIKEIVYYKEYTRIKKGGKEEEKEDEALELAEKAGMVVRKYEGPVYVDIDYHKEKNDGCEGCACGDGNSDCF
jgi:dCMP deaminase